MSDKTFKQMAKEVEKQEHEIQFDHFDSVGFD